MSCLCCWQEIKMLLFPENSFSARCGEAIIWGETRTVDVHIGRLRKKLDFFDVIRTIPKTGYRLED